MSFYAYIWTRQNGSPYYIGKGAGRRAFVNGSHNSCKPKDFSRIQIIHCRDEKSAFETEKFLIKYYGREDIGTGHLLNFSDGGEFSLTGHRHSEETLRKLRRPKTEAHKHKLRLANLGRKLSAEHRLAIGIGQKGIKRSIETCKKISNNNRLRGHFSQETKDKIGAALRGKKRLPFTPETRQKMCDAWKKRSKIFSESHIRNLSAGQRKRWAERKGG